MPSLRDYETAGYWFAHGWASPWLKEVNPSYWPEMIQCIGEHWMQRADWQEHVLTEPGRETLRVQLCLRMSQASDVFVPWLAQALDMRGLRILEIGCGSGSSTAGLAHAGAEVTGVDIKGPSLAIARKRLPLLGLAATFIEAPLDWLTREVDIRKFETKYNLIVCYALLEHLLIPERLHLLSMCRNIMQRDGAMLATFETPNRLAPFDWHSSKLAFADILPDQLAYEFAKRRSPRKDHPAHRVSGRTADGTEALYRFGRGVSFHEFELAIGLDHLQVVLDGYSPRSRHQANYRSSEAYEAALAAVFAETQPPVPPGFCRPSLDLLIRLKTDS